MTKTILTLIAASFTLLGCSHSYSVSENSSAAHSFTQLDQTLAGRPVEITLSEDRRVASTALRITPDSTWWLEATTGRLYGASTRDIVSVTYRHHGRGALHGAGIGSVAGLLVGVASGFALLSQRNEAEATTSRLHYVSVVSMVGLLSGTSVGILWGARRGSPTTYEYPRPSTPVSP